MAAKKHTEKDRKRQNLMVLKRGKDTTNKRTAEIALEALGN